MDTTTVLQTSTASPRGRRPKKSIETNGEPAKKPKKVNSELRKQQNRIASRNYREWPTGFVVPTLNTQLIDFSNTGEKRKRKLQYLQQLLRDDGTSQETDAATEASYDARSRSVSAEYSVHGTPLPSVVLPSTPDYIMFPSSLPLLDPALAATMPYHSPFLTPSICSDSHERSWSPQMPETTTPHCTMSTWDSPQWAPSLDFASQLGHLGPEAFSYAQPQTQPVFETLPSPYAPYSGHPLEANADGYFFTNTSHCRNDIVPSQATPPVSLQSKSPYSQTQYYRAP
jgi:hypothetical protein